MKKRVYYRGYGIVEIPEGASPEQIWAILDAKKASDSGEDLMPVFEQPRKPEEPGFLSQVAKNVKAGVAAIPGALINTAAALPEMIGAVTAGEPEAGPGYGANVGLHQLSSPMLEAAKFIRENPVSKYLSEVPQDQRDDTGNPIIGRQVGDVAGQVAGMMIPGAAGMRGAKALSYILGASQQASQVQQDADRKRAAGMDIAPEDSAAAAVAAMPSAALDVINIGRIGRFLPGYAKHEALKQAAEISGQSYLRPALETGLSALGGAAVESGQQLAANAAIRSTYDPAQALDEGLMDNAIAGGGADAGLELINQILLRKTAKNIHARRQNIAAERARQTAPEVMPGDEEAIGIRSKMDGTPEVKYVQQRGPTRNEILDELSLGLYGKPLSELDAQRGMHLDRSYEDLRKMGMSDQEVVDHLTQPIDLAPDPVQRPTPGLPTALAPDAPPVRLTDEGAIDASAVQYPSLLDQIISQEPALYERLQGQQEIADLLAKPDERGIPTLKKPMPAMPAPPLAETLPDATLNPEGTVSIPSPLAMDQPDAPKFSVGEAQPTPSPNTVAAQRQLLEEGKQSELANSIFGEMQRLGVDDIVSTRLVDNLKVQPNAKGSYANQIISLAMAVQDPQAMKETLHHEAVHAMKAMGLFNDAEWNILQGALNPNSVLSDDERRQYGEIYGDRPDIIQEEAIARGLERYMAGQLSLDGPAKDIATQKMSTLQRIGNAFKSNNLQSPADVASAFKSGEIGRREGTYAVNNAVANDQAGVDTERRISTEAGATQDIPAVDAAQAPEAVDQYDLRAWLTDTDEGGEVKPTTEQRMSVPQLPVNGRIFAEPDSRSQIRKQIDELKSGATPGALGGPGLSLRQQALDARAGIEKLSQQAGTATNAKVGSIPAVRAADVSSEYASAALKNGGLEFVGTPGNGYFRAKKDGPAPFGKDGFFTKAYNNGKLDRVFHYIAGKRGQELMAQGREKLMTPQQIAEYVNYGNDAEVRDAAQQWKQFNDSVVDAVQASGRIDATTAADWKAKTYLPFYRVDPDSGVVTAQGPGALSGTGNIQKLKGSTREIADPIENIVRNVNALTSMAMKNEAMQRVARDGMQMGYMKQAQKGSPAKNQVTLYVDGKPKKFVVTDPILYESVTASRMPASTVMKLAAMPGNFLRESVTLSPAFMVRNMLRDSMMVWAQGYTPVPFANIAADATKALKEGESFKNLERLGVVDAGIRGDGGAGGTAANIRDLMDGPSKNPLTWFKDKSKKSEAANRITVFESVMNRTGGDEAQAAYEARELLNFNRRGASPIAQVLTAMTPFLNARWQGLDVAYRAAMGKGANPQMKKQMITRAVYMGALSSIYAALVSQLPAWQNATPEERDNNWFVPTGDGEAVKVPIPFEFGFVSKVLPERFISAATGKEDWTEALSSFDRFLRGNMKLDMPHVINPVYEVSNNLDRFRGREIEQPWMRKLDKDYRYDENTSELAKEVARYSSLSPVQLDHILRGYLGTSAMYAVNLADVLAGPDPTGTVADIPDRKLSQMPVFGSMFQREDGARKLLEFYEIRNVAEQAKNTLSMLAKSKTPAEEGDRERLNKAAKVETATRAADKRMSDMTKVERQVRGDIKAGNITPGQGRKVLEELRKQKLELAAPVIERYKDAVRP